MRQFDVFPNPSPKSRAIAPFLVLMQSHFLEEMPTALIAPLLQIPESEAPTRVSLRIDFRGSILHLSLAEMAPIRRSELKRAAGDLRSHEFDIRRALDRLFTGF